jgi:hypothetical protein
MPDDSSRVGIAYVRGLSAQRFRQEFEDVAPVLFTPDHPVRTPRGNALRSALIWCLQAIAESDLHLWSFQNLIEMFGTVHPRTASRNDAGLNKVVDSTAPTLAVPTLTFLHRQLRHHCCWPNTLTGCSRPPAMVILATISSTCSTQASCRPLRHSLGRCKFQNTCTTRQCLGTDFFSRLVARGPEPDSISTRRRGIWSSTVGPSS